MNSLFITFEGCDGLGKSRQAEMLRWEWKAVAPGIFHEGPGTDSVAAPVGAVVAKRFSIWRTPGGLAEGGNNSICW